MDTKARLDIRPVTTALGAEIHGIDLSQPIDDATFAELKSAFLDYDVLFFRGQALTEDQHEAFAERFGPINVNRFFKAVSTHPRIAEVRKEANQTTNIGGGWHTDHSYDQVPAMGSILLAREVPSAGGDTLFASMARAYEALSPKMKDFLEGLQALHSARHVFGKSGAYANSDNKAFFGNAEQSDLEAIHPVVLAHPESGKKVLYVNPGFTIRIEGLMPHESQALLQFLFTHAARPEFQYRFHWEPGSIAMWDNRSTWHYALNDYHGNKRLMHRITVEGIPLQ